MTESQKRFLHEYLGEQWKGNITDAICERCGTVFSVNRTFADLKDKQDLLEAIIKKFEWFSVSYQSSGVSGEFIGFERFAKSCADFDFTVWLVQLPPIETAELICRWKGVE